MRILVLQRLLIELAFDIFYFPVWWYSAGLKKTLIGCAHMIATGNRNMAPGMWLKNIFVPMFGQHDIAGRVTSFIVRFANVIGRGIGLCVWIMIVAILLAAWLLFPVVVVVLLFEALF